MAAGNASRIWFSEMVDVLRTQWDPSLSCEELIELAKRLDAQLKQIREERSVKAPVLRCGGCGGSQTQVFRVSVRAVIFAAMRFQMATEAEVKTVEKRWAKYRKQHSLDLYGQPPESQPEADQKAKDRCC